jgi:opacity protein-like surface antigen
LNYFWSKSDIVIDNLEVGVNNGPKYNLDEVVRFTDSYVTAESINVRPDIWLFPFLNVYGILGKANTSTNINAGVWLPDSATNVWEKVFDFGTKAEFNATTFGIGMTPTIGIGGGWLALDMNVSWTDIPELSKPAQAFIFGPRVGKTFKFNKPDSNIAFWTGAFRVHLESGTDGSLALSDVISVDGAQAKVDQAITAVGEKQVKADDWWASLTPAEQKNPVNKSKYEIANMALEKAGSFLTRFDGALSTAENSTVQYSLEKAPKDAWNFIVGTQYQYNRHIMLRAEYGFLGSRTQFLTSLQYRFGL